MNDRPSHFWGRLVLAALVALGVLVVTVPLLSGWSPITVLSRSTADADGAPTVTKGTDAVTAGLVNIDTTLTDGEGAGTGIVLTPTGEVLTNNHVIEGATSITAIDVGNARRYHAEVVGYDRAHDVAVIRLVGASGLATAPLGSSATLAIGDPVTAVGNAGGKGGPPAQAAGTVADLHRTVTAGDESGGSPERLTDVFEVAANVEPGDSGGAIVDRNDTVVGMTTAASRNFRVQEAGGEGFAVPVDQARDIATRIAGGRGGGSIHLGPTAILGVEVSDSGTEEAATGLPRGLMVQDVQAGSSVAQAGLLPGDVITSLDGRPAPTHDALSLVLQNHRPGDRVRLGWVDALNETHQRTIALVAGPPA